MSRLKQQPLLDDLQLLEQERLRLQKAMEKSRQRMRAGYQRLVTPSQTSSTPMGRVMSYFESGMTIYRGVKMGYRIGDTLSMILGVTKLFRRRR